MVGRSGYIITDTSTGSAAYMISGGVDGGAILGQFLFIVNILVFVLSLILIALSFAAAPYLAIFSLGLWLLAYKDFLYSLRNMKSQDEFIEYTQWNIFSLVVGFWLGGLLKDERHAELFVIVIVDIMLTAMADLF